MDLGTDTRSDRALLSDLSNGVKVRQAALVKEWIDIATWARRNIVTSPEQAATIVDGVIDTGVPIAGAGAPLVSEFNLMELIALLGRSPDGGRGYVGRIIECAWRLPGIYAAVVEGKLEPWRAERIADLTRPLNAEAAAFVDRQLAAVGGVGWAQLERLVTEAVIRFDPERAEAERQAAADARRVDVGEVDANGQVESHSVLDAADAHDFDLALSRRAKIRGQLGDTDSFDVRRSKSVGDMARQDLSLDLLFADEETGEVVAESPGRKVELSVHITDTAVTSDDEDNPFANPVGRWDQGRTPISIAQIKEWLRARDTTIIVRPVIDLSDCVPVDSYEIPDRIRRRVELRDHTCRFPWCSRPAAKCDLDHVVPHNKGGPTCTCNLAPGCRRHHRAKTFSNWRYTVILPGHYLWISPKGHHFLVGPDGTRALDPPPRRPRRITPPPPHPAHQRGQWHARSWLQSRAVRDPARPFSEATRTSCGRAFTG
ncbi:HNH endonuclease signature motif containing protein [Nocardioides sp. WS12]|uniref:HNH endonuclease signature motif containing protein n=1 Tax=Nocardioides sp. WS12 TaxID=2486272 RepID=UPI0015FD445D|nr:HNH endonuclease signature motif containing protein [Nocardioides sp. WS12]